MGKETKNTCALVAPDIPFTPFLGTSSEIRHLLEDALKWANQETPVWIQGELGTGKEWLARTLHEKSSRRRRPFVAVRFPFLDEAEQEERLLGWTQTPSAAQGVAGGTLFLQEVLHMAHPLQAKLLKASNEKVFQKHRVRLISSSSQEPGVVIQNGRFPQKLFKLLSPARLEIPPLRKHKEDVPSLVEYFLKRLVPREEKIGIQKEALKILLQYDYPGNLAELKNILEHVLFSRPTLLTREHFDTVVRLPSQPRLGEAKTLAHFIREEENHFISDTLSRCGGNKTLAAKALGISRRNLYRKIEQFSI